MSRPYVFSFVSVNGTCKVLGTRVVMRGDLDEKPKSRCATLYGPGMSRRVVTTDTRRWLVEMCVCVAIQSDATAGCTAGDL